MVWLDCCTYTYWNIGTREYAVIRLLVLQGLANTLSIQLLVLRGLASTQSFQLLVPQVLAGVLTCLLYTSDAADE